MADQVNKNIQTQPQGNAGGQTVPPTVTAAQALEQIQQQVTQINQQQVLLQQQYAQLNVVLQNPQASAQQKQQVTVQMQQLSAQYDQNVKLLQTLSGNHVTKLTGAEVKVGGSKLSMRSILIGCAILFLFLVGGLAVVFYYLLQNPTQLSSVGLDPSTTKTLLQAFAVVFFGLLVFGGVSLLIVNVYRLITVKNRPKLKYAIGSIVGLIVFIVSIALGSQVLSMVNDISANNNLNANNLLLGYLSGSTADIATDTNLQAKLIAPAAVYYTLNSTYFNNQIVPILGTINVSSIQLDCGNGQMLSMLSNYVFNGSCMYLTKGQYALGLIVSYLNVPTGEKLKKSFSGGTINFQSQIDLVSSNGALTYNDGKTEMIAGKVPAKVSFDATQVFRDFNLPDYTVIWYVTDDGNPNGQDVANFTYVYTGAKLYNIKVRFPKLNNFLYTFPLRIEQSDVPICMVNYQLVSATNYKFSTSFYGIPAMISQYEFSILDKKNKDKVIDTIKNTDGIFDYQFPGAGTYAIKAVFLTDVGKQGGCESQDIKVGSSDFDILYVLNYKSPGSPQFKQFGTETGITFENDVLFIKEVPTIVQLAINSVSPASATATKKVLFDGKPVLSSDGKTFEMKVDTSTDHQISIVVEDVTRGAKTEQILIVKINKEDIVGKLIVKPSTVGTDPFTVTFDASTTVLNDVDDEIVYFTRDFGDGEIKKNLSQSVITHTYNYDTKNENGDYKPVLTIKTKKGREISISPETDIIVKKALISLKIHVDSHPAQLAMVGDRVSFSLEVNGAPSTIQWDFGNGKTLECNGRECVQATTIYETPGDYVIKAKVNYADQPTIEGSINLKVQ